MKRISGFDFLRGVAIALVMLHHAEAGVITTRMGWMGVDLFFVLSGFLVSGILFAEYKATGQIKPFVFLIRRGFKIYPLFYFVLLCHVLYFLYKGIPPATGSILAEVFFFQNYQHGIMGVTWSLAVEEHFYLLLVLLFFIVNKRSDPAKSNTIPIGCLVICAICLGLRAKTYADWGYVGVFVNEFPTHLRIDSLSFGVMLSFFFQFRKEAFLVYLKKHSHWLFLLSGLLLVPVFIWERTSWQVNIVGYTFLYLAFGIWVGLMLAYEEKFVAGLKSIGGLFLKFMIWVGKNSYAIYLCHFIVGSGVANWVCSNFFPNSPKAFYVLVYFAANILTGALLTIMIEKPFLRIRDRIFKGYKPVQ
jgi:peptidoglycan/LPS O-acetylase OafA/YrhL